VRWQSLHCWGSPHPAGEPGGKVVTGTRVPISTSASRTSATTAGMTATGTPEGSSGRIRGRIARPRTRSGPGNEKPRQDSILTGSMTVAAGRTGLVLLPDEDDQDVPEQEGLLKAKYTHMTA
jgi:hypothetical protein